MNIILVGCGKVGQKLVEQLNEENEHNITVVDTRAEVVKDLTGQYDVMGVIGSGASIETLEEAGVEKADLLIAVTGSDEINLLTCLIAKKAGNCQTIARVRKPEYHKEINLFKEDLGLEMVINPEQAAAREMARVLSFPSAIQIDSFSKGRVEILKFRIPEDSVLDQLRIMEIGQKLDCDILVCGVERGEDAFIPRGDFVLQAGDAISIVSNLKNGNDFFKTIGIKTNRVKDTMIVGGGDTAYYLAKLLLQSGIHVKIIEKNLRRCEELCRLFPKATIINADGTDNRVLLEEGVEHAESFVSLTNIDEENILLSLFAKSQMKGKGKLITKINRIAYDEVIRNLDLDTTVYPKNITAEYIVRFVRAKKNSMDSNMETMHRILNQKAEALEFKILESSEVTDIPLESLHIKENTLIACISRGGKVIIPRGRDMILVGDNVIVVTTQAGFGDIRDILE
ncbi:MAG: Trk system potassium transporter TrkA [Ruminococcaceae bacterium]|nr:Trk system potassium transporter TrkA [Oscillospiraceae bacterium]